MTPDGKLRSSQNAVQHSLLGRAVVLRWESQELFDDFYLFFRAHYQPANITFDLLPPWDLALDADARESLRRDKKARHALVCRRAIEALEQYHV